MSNSRRDDVVMSRQKKGYPCVSWDDKYFTIHVHPGYDYDISFKTCRTSKEICKWLWHIEEKTWSTNELLGELLRAMADTIGETKWRL